MKTRRTFLQGAALAGALKGQDQPETKAARPAPGDRRPILPGARFQSFWPAASGWGGFVRTPR